MWQRWKSSQTLRYNTNTVLHSWYNIIGIFNILWYSSIEKTYFYFAISVLSNKIHLFPFSYFFATKWYCEPYQSDISVCLKAGNYLKPVYDNIAINCDTFLKVTNLLWSSPIIFLLAFFSSISIHTVYLKSHCAFVIILCWQFCANPLNPYQCLSSRIMPLSSSPPPASTLWSVLP